MTTAPATPGALGARTVLRKGQTNGVVVEDSDFRTLSLPTKSLTVMRNGRTVAPAIKGKQAGFSVIACQPRH